MISDIKKEFIIQIQYKNKELWVQLEPHYESGGEAVEYATVLTRHRDYGKVRVVSSAGKIIIEFDCIHW